MHVAGIDAHATYVVVAIVSNDGAVVQKPIRIKNTEPQRVTDVLEPFRPMEVVVEASPAWPWLYDFLDWRIARIATARKLARAVHAMLRTGEVWRDHV